MHIHREALLCEPTTPLLSAPPSLLLVARFGVVLIHKPAFGHNGLHQQTLVKLFFIY